MVVRRRVCLPRTQTTHILEDSSHKIENHPPKKGGQLGSRYVYIVSFGGSVER